MNIKTIKLIIQKGNVIDQHADAIVHGTNQQFSLKGKKYLLSVRGGLSNWFLVKDRVTNSVI